MVYENIPGWFNYQDFYDQMIEKFNHAIFVEIGAWKGRSAAYMGERIKESKKDIKYFVIDTFKGNPDELIHMSDPDIINRTLYQTFINNIKPLRDYITPLVGDSHLLHNKFNDNSIDFLFIDGDHSFKSVSEDIQLWLPKVKGILSGHDYNWLDVQKAVNETFPYHKIYGENVWYIELNKKL